MPQVQTRGSSYVSGFAHPRRHIWSLGIEDGMHVADFGSGSGHHALTIAERLGGRGYVYAVDIQKELLRRIANEAARLGMRNVEVIWADLEEPRASKIADDAVDLVLISNLLFQVGNKLAVLSEARRILKPIGRMAVIDWHDSRSALGPHKEQLFGKDKALQAALRSGFTLEKDFHAGDHHYGLMFRIANL